MSPLPYFLTSKDDDLLGSSNRSDPMGALAIWSTRARDLVPHLTEQSTELRGFQILVTAYQLWEDYERDHPLHAGRLQDFFILVEQAFARIVGAKTHEWSLPGARRVLARRSEEPCISLDESWCLLDAQASTGIWGLYRGAARRAGLITDDMTRLTGDTLAAAAAQPCFGPSSRTRLFELIQQALDGRVVQLPHHGKNTLVQELMKAYSTVPLAAHLKARLVNADSLNKALAERLLLAPELNHRALITAAAAELPEHKQALENTLRCENLLAPVEAVFLCLCASKGMSLAAAAELLEVDLAALASALESFTDSGRYSSDAAQRRQSRITRSLDTSSKLGLALSVLALHKQVCAERKRALWVWEGDDGLLQSDVDIPRPQPAELIVGAAWRNDYYLRPLHSVAKQLQEVGA